MEVWRTVGVSDVGAVKMRIWKVLRDGFGLKS